MSIIRSPHPDITIPTDLTTWQWAFDSPYSPLHPSHSRHNLNAPIGSYTNATTGESLPYDVVKSHATHISTALVHQYGIQPGDTVSIFSTNSIWYPVAMWAILRVGGRVNGASPSYTASEMTHALKTARTKVLITLESALPTAIPAALAAGIPESKIILLEQPTTTNSNFTTVQQLILSFSTQTPAPPYSLPTNALNTSICAYLNFSSGTTGLPKAVMLSHHNIIAQSHQLRQLQMLPPPPNPYSILAIMPLFHITGLVRFCTYPVFMNGISYILPRYTLPSTLDAITKYQIEELILVPPILLRFARDPLISQYDLRCIKRLSSGSAPIAPEIIADLYSRFPWTGFRQGYGATESTACISCHPPSHYDYRYAATGGMLVANTIAKVVSLDGTNKTLSVGETGEICAMGPQVAMGYLDNEAATKESFREDDQGQRWLHTGDVGYFDNEGLVNVVDRIKEMIKVKGMQVAPAELEDLILGFDGVEDAAVVGIKDGRAGERAKGYVVLKKGEMEERLEEKGRKLMEYVRERKSREKWLVEVEFVQSVPKSATGKLLRRVLKQREWEGRGGERGLVVREEERERAKL